jgi:outer membrane protein OmpA-like peptidoglycan-associated protein
MRARSFQFVSAWALTLAWCIAATGCDHKERHDDNRAQAAWTTASGVMTKRLAGVRERQAGLTGRINSLAIPDGTEDPVLASAIVELRDQLGAVTNACAGAATAFDQATADSTAALSKPDRIAAERLVRSGTATFEATAVQADAAMSAVEPKLLLAESIVKRLSDGIAAEIARLRRIATDGGDVDFSDIDFKVGSAEFDFTHPASKATLDRLVQFAGSCPQLRFGLTGHTSKEGVPARNKTLSLARADAVKAYLLSQGVGNDKVARTSGLGSTHTLVNEPEPGTPAETAMDPSALEATRRRNRRVNVDVITSCSTPAAADVAVPPTPPTPTRQPNNQPH